MESKLENGNASLIQTSNSKRSVFGTLTLCCIIFLCIVLFLCVLTLPIIQIVMGSLYMHSCPMNPHLPIYLISAGVAILILIITYTIEVPTDKSRLWTIIKIVVAILCLTCFITGSVWIFRDKGIVQYHNPKYSSTYCEYLLFSTAYGTMFVNYSLFFGAVCYSYKSPK
ncbi:unnamed protein product [Rotaria sordida]|uniref:Uncharacterized protein n=1 Tax=Rotaria sordida TaxID=392033 RepID=A0A814P7G9_9BILA|nr:unnamed protein product [Rotaria sordida]CAF1303631.1 unnamed protein product [Rotaria sordida]